ncbi:FG-GAP-like repeat-containing protein [Rhodopirellula sp. JC740]|uniref:FG-GAP-like repeat-containing protein n=1 Tax=Rhodopirellula halodulae TaxID=2894198 RepID=A0ABS8NND4_9BACT|nr:FG-GAP-like repeat-containing protein [Rhodopirellula sp. JC740]MCC9645102.1 FG-GAP-like repeat-containing protein [Rhodopirellula sp. JC740]
MSNPVCRFIGKSKRSQRSKKRKIRVSRFEALEARRVLAAAVWNNVTQPADVSGEVVPHVSARDALLVINELNARNYSDMDDGELPRQLDVESPGLYYDVSCDGHVSALDALMVINHLNGIRNEGNGVFPSLACSPVIAEGTDFHNSLNSPWLTLPDDSSAIKVYFRSPEFDQTSQNQILDAFEIELTDEQGNLVTFPYDSGRNAVFNWSESYQPTYGDAVELEAATSEEDSSATINLSGLPEGTRVQITTRLVNNDSDDTSRIIIRGYEVVEAAEDAPVGSSFESRTSVGSSVDASQLQDVSGSFVASYGRTSLAGDDNELLTELVITNRGNQTVTGQLIVVVDDLSELEAAAMHPDGRLPDGRSYWDLTSEMDGNPLAPGESIRSRQIAFKNDSGKRFSYRLQTLGKLNVGPNAFDSVPVSSIEAGMTYSYLATASDPESQSLTYTKVAGPEAMQVDSVTGEVTWATDTPDIGSHRVTLRATDPYGLHVEQTFTLEVLASLQNRPPIFTTDPVTDAIASSGFEVTTVGVGDSPAGVAVIDGFRGPRLVTANAGDQTIGVYAGQNNDRFDEVTNYSTGLPAADGQLFDVGYSVDVGLPEFLRSGDTNDVDGLAQGDFNGDGSTDFAVAFNYYEPGSGSVGTFQATVVLNNGDGSFGSPLVLYERELYAYQTDVDSLSVRDLNGDGFDDIIFAETFAEGRLVTVLGNGDGTFAPAVETTFENHRIGNFKLADIDSDGVPDLFGRTITGGNRNYAMFWSKGLGDGSFAEPDAFIATRHAGPDETPTPYDLGDLDGDGDLDFVLSGEYPNIEVYHNDGIGNFTLVAELDPPNATAYYGPDWLNVADFTGDGQADILYFHVWTGTPLNLYVGDGSGVDFEHQVGNGVFSRLDNWATDHEPVDLDGDGDLDLVMGHEHSDWTSPRVLLNHGDGTFEAIEYPMVDFSGDIKPYQGNDIARGALVGDYNSDGVLDFSYFTTGADFNGVGIRLGTRPGEFGGSASVPVFEGYTGNLVIGDFNGDQIVDLMDLTLGESALGNGNGTYSDPIPAVNFVNGYTGSVADLNLDGLDDVVWARGNRYTVGISNGDGTFTISDDQLAEGSFYGYNSLLARDFNDDGYPDFIAKTGVERQIDVHLNDPSNPGVFSRSFRYVLSDGSQGINVSQWQESFDVADYNADGILDLAFAERDLDTDSIAYTVVMAGDGSGGFTEVSRSPVLDEASRSAAGVGNFYEPGDYNSGDLDGDGDIDLIAATSYGPRVYLNDGSGAFVFHSWLENPGNNQRGRDSWLVDFDEDGILDYMALGTGGYTQVSVRLGNGDATFQPPQRIGMVGGSGGGISRMPFADVNGDGHLDFIHNVNGVGNYNSSTTSIYAGRREDLVDLLAVDLNGDGNEELLAVQEQTDRLQIFVGDNLGGLTRIDDLLTGRAPKAVTTADLDGDGQIELITANRASRDLAVFVGDLESGFTASSVPLDGAPIDVEAGDLDGDGNVDLVALDDQSNALWVFAGDGTTILPEPTAIALGETPSRLTLADATGDGVIDAIVTLPGSQRVMILPGDGVGTFEAPLYVDTDAAPSDVAVVDLNDDSNPDLAIALPDSNVLSIVYGLGNNQFARPQQVSVGESPTRVTLTDADEDGRMDLVVANSGDGTASVVYNRFDPNEVYRYDSDAIDPDGDSITYSIESGPGGLIINSETGELLWAASPDQVGVHDVTLSADDGRGGIATQSFKIEVEPARENAAPIIASMPTTEIGANESFNYQVQTLDNDNHPLRYRLIDGPENAAIDPVTGELNWDGRTQGEAFNWAANGIIRAAASPSLKPESITVEGWFDLTLLNRFNYLVQDQGIYVGTHETDQSIRVDISFPGQGRLVRFFVPITPETDRWYHLALTYDAATGEAKLFVDGELGGSQTIDPTPLDTTPGTTVIGFQNGSTRADIDNYRIWNRARTQAEIQEGMTRQYADNPDLVLDYRFEETDTIDVQDYSMYNNRGYRISYGLTPQPTAGLAETGSHEFTVSVEDGRGGYDEQTFTLNVLPELRGSITGQLFDDLNGDGDRDDGSESGVAEEPWLENWHLFIDINGNSYPDPDEPQATTDASGSYFFPGLLPGEYPVKVSPVAGYETPTEFTATVESETKRELDPASVENYDSAIEALSLSQIRGQLQTEDGDAIAYWKVFADLDGDGTRGDDEPMAMSDRDGNYALSGLDAGTYNIKPDVPAGWVDSAGRDGLDVVLAADAIATDNDFVLEPTNTSVTGGLHFVTMPATEVEARQTFRYAAVAMGISESAITYDLSLAPEGMAVDPNTGLTAWRPTIDQVGEHLVILRATDESGSISLHDFYLNVTAPNTPPVIVEQLSSAAQRSAAYVNHNYSYDVIAQDAESTELTFALGTAPSGAAIDPSTGRIDWTPVAGDVGSHDFTVEVADEAGATTSATWTVEVQSISPAVLPLDVTLPRSTAAVTTDYFSRISARDAIGRPVTWSLTSGPSGMTVVSDGTIEWTPSNSQLGEQSVEFEATTADGDTETVSFTIEVLGRLQNAVPVIQSQPNLSTTIGQAFRYDVQVDDADGDIHAFTLLEGPIGMSIHPSLGHVVWNPAADQLGEHDVLLQVSDPSGATVEQSFTLTVSRFGGPPRITSVPPTEAYVGSGFLYSVQSVDREGDPLTYSLLTAPAGMTIVENTGEISWTPAAGQVGTQDVVIQVSDGIGGAATQAFVVNVNAGAANLPPAVNSIAPRFGAVGTDFNYTLSASDPEGTTITYSLGQGPAGMSVDAATGQVTWVPAAGDEGKHIVTFIATDAGGGTAIESFELDVLAQNTAPSITSTAPTESTAGALFTYQVLASDADLDALTFELTEAPEGAVVDAFGRIEWPTELGEEGTYSFEVTAADPRGGEVMQSFDLELVADTEGPAVSLIERPNDASRNVQPWQGPFVVYARAIDNVEVASLTLTANGQDIPLDASGTATFTFEDWTFQTINATATAIDTSGNVTTKSITFNYDIPEGWSGVGGDEIPTAIITSPADAESVTGMVSISGTAAHEDFDIYRLSYRRVDETTYTEFHTSSTAVENGELGVWDTSLLLNDEYVIRLEVATSEGIANVVERYVGLAGELKLGNFQLSFTDMVIPVAGIPIEITRIYDTLQADREGDFGYGWRLEYRNTDLRVGLPKSGLEDIGIYSALRPGVKVYLNVPGEGRQGFTFNPDIRVLPGWGGNNLVLARPKFTPDPGVTSTLSTGTSAYLHVNELGELHAPGRIPYNPASPDFGGAYVLTTQEGLTYRISGASGELDSASDANGNTLRFTDAGISYGDQATSVTITRDSVGRIRSIADPKGQTVQYRYSSNGDLAKVIDREGNESTLSYDPSKAHYLEDIIDPLGRTGAKTDYDENGRLINIVDALGNPIAFSSDPNNFVESITDADGNEYSVEYDQAGNIVTQVDARGAVTRRTFDSQRNLTSETDPLGNTTTYTYDASGNVISITDPLGGKQTYRYGRNGVVVEEVDPTGAKTSWTQDAQGNLLTRTDPEGHVTSYTYDSSGNLLTETDVQGNMTSYTYDVAGNVLLETDPLGHTTAYTYDASGNKLTETFALTQAFGVVQATTTWGYDSNDRVVSITDALGNIERTEYNELGLESARIDANGNRTEYNYDERGLLLSTIFADGTSTSVEYDDNGRQIQSIDQLGRVTKYIHDAVGNVISTIYPDETPGDDSDNPRTYTEYDLASRRTKSVDEEGNENQYAYDDNGRLRTLYLPDSSPEDLSDNIVISTVYDARGYGTLTEDPTSSTKRYEYDSRGNLIATHFADGTVTRQTFDSLDRRVETVDQNGIATRYEYDPSGRLTAVIQSLEGASDPRTEYVYDERGNMTRQTDPNGNVTEYHYDVLSRRVGTTMALGQESSMTYDPVGNVATHTNFNGETILYSFDVMNRVQLRELPDGTSFAFTYTASGRTETVVDERGTTIYDYDARDRVLSRTEPDGVAISYTYDLAGREVTQTTPAGTVAKTYDPLGNLVTVTDPDGGVTTYVYDDRGRQVEIQFPNGVTDSYTLDDLSRILRIESNGPSGLLRSMDYTLDATGRRIGIAEQSGRVVEYEYDSLYRLTVERITDPALGDRTIEYTYDLFGNRLSKLDSVEGLTTYAYDANDRLLQTNTNGVVTTYTYDANGNTLTEFTDSNNQRSYSWDAENRLVASTIVQDSNTTEASYKYDEEGLRVEATTDGETTRSLLDKNVQYAQVVLEYATNGEIEASYVRGNQLISMHRSGKVAYNHADAAGTVRIMTDAAGAKANSYIYDAFGNVLEDSVALRTPFLFAGEYRDQTLGWDYLRARYNDPSSARFISRDEFDGFIMQPGSLNRYLYVTNDPLNFVDPSGKNGLLLEQLPTLGIQVGLLLLVGIAGSIATQSALEAGLAQTLVNTQTQLEIFRQDLVSRYYSGTQTASLESIQLQTSVTQLSLSITLLMAIPIITSSPPPGGGGPGGGGGSGGSGGPDPIRELKEIMERVLKAVKGDTAVPPHLQNQHVKTAIEKGLEISKNFLGK